MNLKLLFVDSHISYSLGDYSEEQSEMFHQDLKVMEQRYQGRWIENLSRPRWRNWLAYHSCKVGTSVLIRAETDLFSFFNCLPELTVHFSI